jgi:hypothetical protein
MPRLLARRPGDRDEWDEAAARARRAQQGPALVSAARHSQRASAARKRPLQPLSRPPAEDGDAAPAAPARAPPLSPAAQHAQHLKNTLIPQLLREIEHLARPAAPPAVLGPEDAVPGFAEGEDEPDAEGGAAVTASAPPAAAAAAVAAAKEEGAAHGAAAADGRASPHGKRARSPPPPPIGSDEWFKLQESKRKERALSTLDDKVRALLASQRELEPTWKRQAGNKFRFPGKPFRAPLIPEKSEAVSFRHMHDIAKVLHVQGREKARAVFTLQCWFRRELRKLHAVKAERQRGAVLMAVLRIQFRWRFRRLCRERRAVWTFQARRAFLKWARAVRASSRLRLRAFVEVLEQQHLQQQYVKQEKTPLTGASELAGPFSAESRRGERGVRIHQHIRRRIAYLARERHAAGSSREACSPSASSPLASPRAPVGGSPLVSKGSPRPESGPGKALRQALRFFVVHNTVFKHFCAWRGRARAQARALRPLRVSVHEALVRFAVGVVVRDWTYKRAIVARLRENALVAKTHRRRLVAVFMQSVGDHSLNSSRQRAQLERARLMMLGRCWDRLAWNAAAARSARAQAVAHHRLHDSVAHGAAAGRARAVALTTGLRRAFGTLPLAFAAWWTGARARREARAARARADALLERKAARAKAAAMKALARRAGWHDRARRALARWGVRSDASRARAALAAWSQLARVRVETRARAERWGRQRALRRAATAWAHEVMWAAPARHQVRGLLAELCEEAVTGHALAVAGDVGDRAQQRRALTALALAAAGRRRRRARARAAGHCFVRAWLHRWVAATHAARARREQRRAATARALQRWWRRQKARVRTRRTQLGELTAAAEREWQLQEALRALGERVTCVQRAARRFLQRCRALHAEEVARDNVRVSHKTRAARAAAEYRERGALIARAEASRSERAILDAVLQLQPWWRGVWARRFSEAVKRARARRVAAVRVQRCFRAHLSRRHRAATRVQAWQRAVAVRLVVRLVRHRVRLQRRARRDENVVVRRLRPVLHSFSRASRAVGVLQLAGVLGTEHGAAQYVQRLHALRGWREARMRILHQQRLREKKRRAELAAAAAEVAAAMRALQPAAPLEPSAAAPPGRSGWPIPRVPTASEAQVATEPAVRVAKAAGFAAAAVAAALVARSTEWDGPRAGESSLRRYSLTDRVLEQLPRLTKHRTTVAKAEALLLRAQAFVHPRAVRAAERYRARSHALNAEAAPGLLDALGDAEEAKNLALVGAADAALALYSRGQEGQSPLRRVVAEAAAAGAGRAVLRVVPPRFETAFTRRFAPAQRQLAIARLEAGRARAKLESHQAARRARRALAVAWRHGWGAVSSARSSTAGRYPLESHDLAPVPVPVNARRQLLVEAAKVRKAQRIAHEERAIEHQRAAVIIQAAYRGKAARVRFTRALMRRQLNAVDRSVLRRLEGLGITGRRDQLKALGLMHALGGVRAAVVARARRMAVLSASRLATAADWARARVAGTSAPAPASASAAPAATMIATADWASKHDKHAAHLALLDAQLELHLGALRESRERRGAVDRGLVQRARRPALADGEGVARRGLQHFASSTVVLPRSSEEQLLEPTMVWVGMYDDAGRPVGFGRASRFDPERRPLAGAGTLLSAAGEWRGCHMGPGVFVLRLACGCEYEGLVLPDGTPRRRGRLRAPRSSALFRGLLDLSLEPETRPSSSSSRHQLSRRDRRRALLTSLAVERAAVLGVGVIDAAFLAAEMAKNDSWDLNKAFELVDVEAVLDAEAREWEARAAASPAPLPRRQEGQHPWSEYDGEWDDEGRLHGRGVLRLCNGTTYRGSFERGLPSGVAVVAYADGSSYVGEFRNGMRSGRGRWASAGGVAFFEGAWQNGVRHGYGREWDALAGQGAGRGFEGRFEAGLRHGRGKELSELGQCGEDGEVPLRWRPALWERGELVCYVASEVSVRQTEELLRRLGGDDGEEGLGSVLGASVLAYAERRSHLEAALRAPPGADGEDARVQAVLVQLADWWAARRALEPPARDPALADALADASAVVASLRAQVSGALSELARLDEALLPAAAAAEAARLHRERAWDVFAELILARGARLARCELTGGVGALVERAAALLRRLTVSHVARLTDGYVARPPALLRRAVGMLWAALQAAGLPGLPVHDVLATLDWAENRPDPPLEPWAVANETILLRDGLPDTAFLHRLAAQAQHWPSSAEAEDPLARVYAAAPPAKALATLERMLLNPRHEPMRVLLVEAGGERLRAEALHALWTWLHAWFACVRVHMMLRPLSDAVAGAGAALARARAAFVAAEARAAATRAARDGALQRCLELGAALQAARTQQQLVKARLDAPLTGIGGGDAQHGDVDELLGAVRTERRLRRQGRAPAPARPPLLEAADPTDAARLLSAARATSNALAAARAAAAEARRGRDVELAELAACRAHAAKLESERGPAISKAERGLRAVEAAQLLSLYDSGCAVPRAVGAVIGAVGLLLGAPTASLVDGRELLREMHVDIETGSWTAHGSWDRVVGGLLALDKRAAYLRHGAVVRAVLEELGGRADPQLVDAAADRALGPRAAKAFKPLARWLHAFDEWCELEQWAEPAHARIARHELDADALGREVERQGAIADELRETLRFRCSLLTQLGINYGDDNEPCLLDT